MRLGVREIAFIALLIVIPVGAWWFAFRPNNACNAAMMEQIQTRQAKLQALNQATGTIGDLKVEIGALDDAIKFFRSKLPTRKEIDKVLKEVWELADANQLKTKSIRTLSPDDNALFVDSAGPFAEQPISMRFEGSFEGFYRFLLALEAQARIIRIHKMKLEKLPEDKDGQVRAACTISVFFENSPKD